MFMTIAKSVTKKIVTILLSIATTDFKLFFNTSYFERKTIR